MCGIDCPPHGFTVRANTSFLDVCHLESKRLFGLETVAILRAMFEC